MTVDLKREIDAYRARRDRFSVVTVPALQYLMVDGDGDPNTSPAYRDALATLFPLAYTLKFLSRNALGRDHTVMPLEALWWADDPAAFTTARDKDRWSWTTMILLPDWIMPEHVEQARHDLARNREVPALDAVRLAPLDEGLSVQTLHVGPYDEEGPVLARMHREFLPENGFRPTGHHHEIYLSDARRTAPARLRTILRQPVAGTD